MIGDRRPDRLRPERRTACRVLAPVANLVCDGPFAEAREYAASVFTGRTVRGERDVRPAAASDLPRR